MDGAASSLVDAGVGTTFSRRRLGGAKTPRLHSSRAAAEARLRELGVPPRHVSSRAHRTTSTGAGRVAPPHDDVAATAGAADLCAHCEDSPRPSTMGLAAPTSAGLESLAKCTSPLGQPCGLHGCFPDSIGFFL